MDSPPLLLMNSPVKLPFVVGMEGGLKFPAESKMTQTSPGVVPDDADGDRPRKRQKLEHSASSESLASSTSSFSSSSSKNSKGRRRVQIQAVHTSEHPPPAHHHGVLDEKPSLWYTQEDFSLTLQSMKEAIQSLKQVESESHVASTAADGASNELGSRLSLYGESLASTYLACCVDSDSSVSSSIPASITPSHLERLGTTARGDHRGMETCALPDLAAERNLKRREIIRNVVFLNRTLHGVTRREEFVRSLSEQMTAPSRKFAQAMGISDTLSALATYAEAEGHDDGDGGTSQHAAIRQPPVASSARARSA